MPWARYELYQCCCPSQIADSCIQLKAVALDKGYSRDECSDLDTCNEGRLKSCIDGIHSPSPILEQVWIRVHHEELNVNFRWRKEPREYWCTISPTAEIKAVKYKDEIRARCIVSPFKQNTNGERSLHPYDEMHDGLQSVRRLGNDEDEQEQQLHGIVDVVFLRNRRFSSNQHTCCALSGGCPVVTSPHCRTESSSCQVVVLWCWTGTFHAKVSYIIALSKGIAADISHILDLPDDGVDESLLGEVIEIFHGESTVSACMV